MRPVLRSLLTLSAASVALAACTDTRSSEPTAPSQLRPAFALGPVPASCNITALRDNARIYFAKSNDPIYKIISDLAKLPTGTFATAATTNKAFDGLARMALVRLTSLQNSSATAGALGTAFDALAKGFLGCAQSSVREGVLDVDFTSFVQDGYLFEVRGGSGELAGAY